MLDDIRLWYSLASQQEKEAEKLFEFFEKNPPKNAILWAYKGASDALKAKNLYNPLSKWHYVAEADKAFGKAIFLDKENIEIRFLRFSIEWNLPRLLGYSTHLEEDKNIILKNFEIQNNLLPAELSKAIKKCLLDSNLLNNQEKLWIMNYEL